MEILDEYTKTDLEEQKAEQEKAFGKMTEAMTLFYDGISNGVISPETEERKKKEIDIFTGSLVAKGFEPTKYRLYHILMNQELVPGEVYEFDTPNPIDPYGPGLIQQFIENNFLRKK